MHGLRESRGERVLIVDDKPRLRRAMHQLLSGNGYACVEAGSVSEAITLLEAIPFALILSDICMPGGSGLKLVEHLRNEGLFPQTVIVMVTANDEVEVAVQALELGAYGYIFKPFQGRELLVQVANALRRRELELSHQRTEAQLTSLVRKKTEEIQRAHEEIVIRLTTAAEFRDNQTGQHIRRLGLYAAELGRLLGWSVTEQDRIRMAAAMHDVGKIGIRDHILLKPGKLTAEEWVTMKTHTTIGHYILSDSGIPVLEMADRIAWCHHERWDGSGYPGGLRGEDIPIEARVVAVVDVYDALCHARPYKKPWPEPDVIAMMQELRGKQFDPQLVDLFIDNLSTMRAIRLANAERAMPQPEASGGMGSAVLPEVPSIAPPVALVCAEA